MLPPFRVLPPPLRSSLPPFFSLCHVTRRSILLSDFARFLPPPLMIWSPSPAIDGPQEKKKCLNSGGLTKNVHATYYSTMDGRRGGCSTTKQEQTAFRHLHPILGKMMASQLEKEGGRQQTENGKEAFHRGITALHCSLAQPGAPRGGFSSLLPHSSPFRLQVSHPRVRERGGNWLECCCMRTGFLSGVSLLLLLLLVPHFSRVVAHPSMLSNVHFVHPCRLDNHQTGVEWRGDGGGDAGHLFLHRCCFFFWPPLPPTIHSRLIADFLSLSPQVEEKGGECSKAIQVGLLPPPPPLILFLGSLFEYLGKRG